MIIKNRKNIDPDELEMLYDDINVQAVFSIREDRLSELNYLAEKIPDIQQVFYQLAPLDNKQATQAIQKPAQKEGEFDSPKFVYEKASIDKIINTLSNKGKHTIETTQLQIVCQRIEENISNKAEQDNIVVGEREIPDFKDIFLNYYNDTVSKVDTDEPDKVNKFIEDQLIIGGRRISLDQLVCEKYVKKETLKVLVDCHFLRAERNSTEGVSYELSHDTLIEPIAEQAEIRRKQEDTKKIKAKLRRRLRIILLSVLVAVVSIGAAIFGYINMNKAKKNEKEAKIQKEIAINETKKAQILSIVATAREQLVVRS